MATIVTAYFHLPYAKKPHSTYCVWMQNMLIIDNPMVIFCDKESEPLIQSLRAAHMDKTQIVTLTFEEFHCIKYIQYFESHYNMDTEQRVGHNIYLYMIWNEKPHFVKRAIDMNPFHTDKFLWVDIGCFRKPNEHYIHWPNQERIPMDKVLLLSVNPFEPSELSCKSEHELPLFQFKDRIGGTIFGGGKELLLLWHTKYYSMLEHFITIHRFIGKDQSIINSVYLLNRDKCELVNWIEGCHDPWFYLQDYLTIE